MKKRHTPEQISDVLRRMEETMAAGRPATKAARDCGVGLATYYVWRRDYGGMTVDQLRRVKELEAERKRLRKQIQDVSADNTILRAVLSERLSNPTEKRWAVQHARQVLGVSERRACTALALPRSSHRYRRSSRNQAGPLLDAMRRLCEKHPRYGYRRIAALLRAEGWSVGDIQVYRLRRREDEGKSR